MARRTRKQTAEAIELLRWLYWETLRRSPKYRLSVKQLLGVLRLDGRKSWRGDWSGINFSRRSACRAYLAAYRALITGKVRSGPLLVGGRLKEWTTAVDTAARRPRESKTQYALRRQEVMAVVEEAEKRRYFSGPRKDPKTTTDLFRPGERKDALPELQDFSSKWGVRFPLPPSTRILLEDLLVGPWACPVNPRVRSRTDVVRGPSMPDDQILQLEVRTHAGREICNLFLEGALFHHLPTIVKPSRSQPRRQIVSRKSTVANPSEWVQIKPISDFCLQVSIRLTRGKVPIDLSTFRKLLAPNLRPSRFKFRSREHYEQMLRAFDLYAAGGTRSAIARALWPGLIRDANSVRNLHRSFQNLAATFEIEF